MPKSTLRRPTAISIGIERGKLEIKQFMRQRESVVFTMLFPLILLAIFGSVFSESIAEGVTFSQYFVAGMIASGLVNTGFQQLAIMIPMERDFGTLKRLRGTPMPASSYFIGKAILVTLSMLIQVALLLAAGVIFFGVELPATSQKWLLLAALLVLGSACSTVLGIAFSNVPKSGRSASAVVSPVVIVLQFFSGDGYYLSCKSGNEISKVMQPTQFKLNSTATPIPKKCFKLKKKASKTWSDAQTNMMMHAFLRDAEKELSAGNIKVSFNDLKLGDLAKLCNATACLLMRNQDYMKMSTQKNLTGQQIRGRLRFLVGKVEKMQVGIAWAHAA